ISPRENSDSTFLARLKAMPANDPGNDRAIDAPTGNGHIFLLAEPCAPISGRDVQADIAPVIWNEIVNHATGGVLGSLTERTRDSRGLGLAFPVAAEQTIERQNEDDVAHLLVLDEDNSIEFVSGGGTYYRRGGPGGEDGTELVGTPASS
ncbi:MAG: hypothetical protein ACRCWS_02840, partial [Propionibacteriaceae bacterium]